MSLLKLASLAGISLLWSIGALSAQDIEQAKPVAMHKQTGENADCSAAVEHWKGAVVHFTSMPPEYEGTKEFYKDARNVSFVALFNPKAGATVDCAYITCPIKTSAPEEDGGSVSGDGDGEQEEEEEEPGVPPQQSGEESLSPTPPNPDPDTQVTEKPNDGGLEGHDVALFSARGIRSSPAPFFRSAGVTVTQDARVLLCATKPAALEKNVAPFSESQYQKIKEALSSSGSISTTSVPALLLASVGMTAVFK
ncbi:hypothetical protein Emag_002162 [Eimeria magna]